MPSTYAHKYFGAKVYKALPEDVKELIKDNQEEYLAGLHGPDILFFYRPGTDSNVNAVGNKLHRIKFSETLGKAIANLKDNYSDESLVYLLGMLTHYYLDSAVHPTVTDGVEELGLSHGKLEMEFDRKLLDMQGKKTVGYKAAAHIPVLKSVAEAAGFFYEGVSVGQILESLASMKAINLLCETDADSVRKGICKVMDKTGNTEKVASLVMSRQKSDMAKKCIKKMNNILQEEVAACASAVTIMARCYEDFVITDRFDVDFLGR